MEGRGPSVEGKGCGVLKGGNVLFYGEEAVTGARRTCSYLQTLLAPGLEPGKGVGKQIS